MIQYQVNGLIQIKLAAQPLCLISSFFFLLFELQLNNFHFCDLFLSLPLFLFLLCYVHEKRFQKGRWAEGASMPSAV